MATADDSEANVGNSRWYCHACEVETEALTEVTHRLCSFLQIRDVRTLQFLSPRQSADFD